MQEGAGTKPNQGAIGVQFQTPLRTNLETTYMDNGNSVWSGRDLLGSEPLRNQYLNPIARGISGDFIRWDEEIKVLKKLLNKLPDKVYSAGGSGYTFKGRPVRSQLDVEALLEKELPSKYVPVSCFVCPVCTSS